MGYWKVMGRMDIQGGEGYSRVGYRKVRGEGGQYRGEEESERAIGNGGGGHATGRYWGG